MYICMYVCMYVCMAAASTYNETPSFGSQIEHDIPDSRFQVRVPPLLYNHSIAITGLGDTGIDL